jgi:predicted nucleic acid-binding protein
MKIICDSSTLISLAETCNLKALYLLKEKKIEFFITKKVKEEIIENPVKIKKYEYSALKIEKCFEDGVIKEVEEDEQKTRDLTMKLNSYFEVRGRPLNMVQEGEVSCISVYKDLNFDAFAVDEKTTRFLIENPEVLRAEMEKEYGGEVKFKKASLPEIQVLRSTEILYFASRKGYFSDFKNQKKILNAGLQALKYAGCSISEEELSEYETL